MQDCSNSIANAQGLLQTCNKPLTCSLFVDYLNVRPWLRRVKNTLNHVKVSQMIQKAGDTLGGLVQERRNSIANALELRFSCTNSSTWRQRHSITWKSFCNSTIIMLLLIFRTVPKQNFYHHCSHWWPGTIRRCDMAMNSNLSIKSSLVSLVIENFAKVIKRHWPTSSCMQNLTALASLR